MRFLPPCAVVLASAIALAQAPAPGPVFPLPAGEPEVVSADRDFPYVPGLPGSRLIETRTVSQPLEVKQAGGDQEAVIAGQSFVEKTYEAPAHLNAIVFVQSYRDALFASGWKLLDVPKLEAIAAQPETVSVAAHYRDAGRNLYVRLMREPDGRYRIRVADVGAEDWPAQLARECRVRVYSLHFEHERADLKLIESEPTLRKLAEVLKLTATPPLEIQGHMDNVGESGVAARDVLALGRARSVMMWLVTHGGVPANKVTAKGYGKSRPVAENDTDLGRALNRRIEAACAPTSRPGPDLANR